MSLVLRRLNSDESWLDAAIRQASPYGLEQEIRDFYHRFRDEGDSEEDAAWGACYEWDVLDVVDEPCPWYRTEGGRQAIWGVTWAVILAILATVFIWLFWSIPEVGLAALMAIPCLGIVVGGGYEFARIWYKRRFPRQSPAPAVPPTIPFRSPPHP